MFLMSTGCGTPSTSQLEPETAKPQAPQIDYEANNRAALQKIKAEPKVLDAVITDANVLYVGVVNDGTRRDGYASYCCEVLSDFDTKVKMVKVVENGSSTSPRRDNAYGILLGQSFCRR